MRTLLAVAFTAVSMASHAAGAEKDAAKLTKQLESFVKGNRAGAIGGLIKEAAEADEPKCAVLIPQAALAIPSAANYATAVDAIAGLKNEPAVEALAGVLKKSKGDYRQKVLVLEAFGKRTDKPTLDAVLGELKCPIVHVQVAAIRAARARKERACLAPLVGVLEDRWKARDRTWYEASEALVSLTGQQPESIEDWKKLVAGLPESWTPKDVGKETGPTRIEVKKVEESVQFFGREVFSNNLIFVVDVSGSMYMYDDSDDYKGKNVEEDRRRITRTKDQLSQALKKLPKAANFNIITFSDKVVPWQKQMQPASPATIAAALKFVNEFQARGATHTDEALELAFKDLSVDTIVLLSDGAPMKKDNQDSKGLVEKITARVKDLNASRKVKIHTFGFEGAGTWPKKVPWAGGMKLPPPPSGEELKVFVEFLKNLAAESGGDFEAVR